MRLPRFIGLVIAMVWTIPATATARTLFAPSSPVALAQALRDAKQLAARHPGLRIVHIEGTSMLPSFGAHTLLLIKATRSEDIREGMIVVYRNRFGNLIAHRIIGGSAHTGWVAQGYHNQQPDSTLVTDQNLIGTVYVTFLVAESTDATLTESCLSPSNDLISASAAPAQ